MSPLFQSSEDQSLASQGLAQSASYPFYHETDAAYSTTNPHHVSSVESEGPEVVAAWVHDQERIHSPLSTDGTVVSAYQSTRLNEKGEPIALSISETPPQKSRRRIWWLCGIGALVLLILIGVGLGVGLTLGMKKTEKDPSTQSDIDPYCAENPQYCIGGSLDSRYYSTSGVFNGSGIALAGESWDKNTHRFLTIYFQHHTGTLRWVWQDPDSGWQGGTSSEIVADDVKDASPISTVAYVLNPNTTNATSVHHVFYIGKDDCVKERVKRNDSFTWSNGPLNSLNLKAYSAPNVGLQACWYGNYYGDSDISQTNNITYNTPGMHLWYPLDESTFELWGWYLGKSSGQWERNKDQSPWMGKNTHAGVGCYSWGDTNTTYAMMPTDAHPINDWSNATGASFSGVYPSTSLGYTDYFYTQMQDGSIMSRNITWTAENSTINQIFTIGDRQGSYLGIKGTHLTVSAVGTKSNGSDLLAFYQTIGNDITLFRRDLDYGDWDTEQLNIPDD